ncbi:MAG: DUF4870 domain-containing protein [Wenzhouxiangellaceae bacterium]|nr:DUF4870 domain-containing protein [Wenzhouxiangellaceae bacterium]
MTDIETTETPEPGQDPKELKLWATLLHLSLLAGLVIPLGGLIVPIVIYMLKKDELPGLEPHFHVVLNWIMSAVIYFVICFILFIIVIGIFMMWALGLLALIFPIIGAIKANDGVVWEYPLSIRFFGK